MKNLLSVAVSALLLPALLLTTTSVRGDSVSEDFSLSGADRAADAPLNGVLLPKSQIKWVCTEDGVHFGGMAPKGYGVMTTDKMALAWIKLPFQGDVLEVKADVQPTGKPCWVAIGIGQPRDGKDNCWADGMMLLMNDAGGYQIFGKGLDQKLGEGAAVADYKAGGLNSLRMVYNKKDKTLQCYINEHSVVDPINLGSLNINPDASCAGFSSFGQTPNTKAIQSFSATVK